MTLVNFGDHLLSYKIFTAFDRILGKALKIRINYLFLSHSIARMTSDFEKKIVKPSRKSLYFDETPIVIYQSHKHNKRKK